MPVVEFFEQLRVENKSVKEFSTFSFWLTLFTAISGFLTFSGGIEMGLWCGKG